MENKTLSKQICELCEIKPRKVCSNNDGICDNCYSTNEIKLQQKEKGYIGNFASCNYDTDNQEKCRNFRFKKEIYVNFENPVNFVKLLELGLDNGSYTLGKIINTAMINQNRKEFLTTLKHFLAQECQYSGGVFNWDELDINEIKHTICNYDKWVWE